MTVTLATGLRCVRCDARYPLGPMFEGCPRCATGAFRSGLTPDYDYAGLAAALGGGVLEEDGPGLWRYRRLLPVVERSHEVSLGEGATPLVPVPRLAEAVGAAALWVKDESRNPTGSFKDRHAAVSVGKALDLGARTLVASSSGNAGAAVAAYATRAGLGCVVLTYPGVPAAARVPIQALGGRLVVTTHEGRFALMREAVARLGWYPVTNLTDVPTNGAYGHEGYKTIAYELHAQLGGEIPDLVAVPTAYAEGLFGIWKGFRELVTLGRAPRAPRMLACEPAGGPLAMAFHGGGPPVVRVPRAPTVARGIGGAANSYVGVAALAESGGLVAQAADPDILAAQRALAAEGLFVDPAAAAAVAGLQGAARAGRVPRGLRVVVVATSSGLKNLQALEAAYPEPPEIAPELEAMLAALEAPARTGASR
jgi:threonine synthase